MRMRTRVMTVENSSAEALQAPFLPSSVSCSSCAPTAPAHPLELCLSLLFPLHPPPSLPTHLSCSDPPLVLFRCDCTFPLPLAQDPGCCGPEQIYLGQKSHSAAPAALSPCLGSTKVPPGSLELMKGVMRTRNDQVPIEWVLAPFQIDFT